MTATRLSARDRVVHGVKLALAYGLYYAGVLQLWRRLTLKRKAIVLTYHRVLDPDAMARTWSHPAILVARDSFERQLQLLRRQFHLLPPDDFARCVAGECPFPSSSCLVTFDDGWIDTFTEAWPLLTRHGVPAIVFLPTRFIGSNELFWQERLGALLHVIAERAAEDPAFAPEARRRLALHGCDGVLDGSPELLRQRILDQVQALKQRAPADALRVADALAPLVPPERLARTTLDTFMSWDHVREMHAAGVAFGAHSVSHRILPTLDREAIEGEVRGSQRAVTDALGHAPSLFSYPNGDWNADCAAAVRDAGFAAAFSTARGTVDGAADRFALHRINMHEDVTRHVPLFFARILGVL